MSTTATARDADTVVVGGGGSGLAAAISAAYRGRRVILVEKRPRLGGSTGLSVGSFSAAGTSMQLARGISDDIDAFREDMVVSNGALEQHENATLRELLLRESRVTFEWLRSLGVQFFGPTPDPPFVNPRMHNVVPNSRAYITALQAEAKRLGVDIRTNTPVEELLTDSSGRVVGVRARDRLLASSVILGTGDYSASREYKQRWISEETGMLPPMNPGNTGDGFRMALDLGAETRNTWRALEDLRFPAASSADLLRRLPTGRTASRVVRVGMERLPRRTVSWIARHVLTGWVTPSRDMYVSGAILVGPRGTRFANELDTPARGMAREPENRCYIVFDADVADRFSAWPHPVSTFPGMAYAYLPDYATLRRDLFHKSNTLGDLAISMRVPPHELEATVATYNAIAAGDRDDHYGREELGPGVLKPPFVALGPLSARVSITDGGLVVDESCRVLRDGEPIPGLYAVGATGQAGLILRNHGLHLAWAMTSGRTAGAASVADG